MKSYSIVFLVFVVVLPLLEGASLPCPSNCGTCSSSTQCTTCASQYFANSSSGSLQCQPCGQFCLNCTSSTNCTSCISPYVIQLDGSCKQCQISNAAKCSSTVSASQCNSGYYVSDNYCYSCLLNCADCSSSADCRSCISGYYLNSSVLTCNFCPANCLTCDQYNSSRCLTCADGYMLSVGYTCDSVSCGIANCLYCLSVSVCKMCQVGYYWSSSQGTCLAGASVLCLYGAQGPFPNQCTNKCSPYSYTGSQISSSLWCLPYKNIKLNTSTYTQTYLYSYNNLADLTQLLSTSNSLTLQSTGQYSYLVSASNTLSISSLSSFYKITIYIKYKSNSAILLNLSSSTESGMQYQNATLPAYATVATAYKFSTVFLHSNNLKILFNASLNLVELLIRTKNCPSDCYRCLNEDLCEMCNAPQYVSSYKCVDNCTIYYHLVTNRTCLTTCPDYFYPTNLGINQKFCQPCVSPCSKCLTSTKCLSCVPGKYLYNYTCLTTCPDTYYPGSSTLCQPCISPCKLCINQTKCISCREGYWDSVNSVCTMQCPNGYYGNDVTQKCQPCQSPCLTCRNSSVRCLTCITNYYYHEYQCLSSCPLRYYPVPSNMTCAACRLPCLTCSSLSSCLSCSYDFFYNSSCIPVCPDGYFQNLVNKSCQACSIQCQTCQMLGQCVSCKNGTCLLQGSCISSCPVGKYYPTTLNTGLSNQQCICQQCKLPCKQCLSSTKCISCLKGYLYASTYQCLNSCPTAYFSNNLTYQCTPCSAKFTINCLQCNSTSCTRCASNYLLHNGLCLTACPSLHYKSSQTCHKCVAPCLQCVSFTQCSSCISPYLFSNGSCIIECPFGKVSILNITSNILSCISCQSPCITCQNSSPTNCTMCTYGYFLYADNNTCLTNCSSIPTTNTYYNELATSTCSKCMYPCKTCSSQTQCLTCQIGFLTGQAKCQNCPVSTYANETQGICLPCPSQCSNCYSSDYCTGCKSGFYLYSHQCISNTSICTDNGYFAIGRVCEPCDMPCNHCNVTSTNCLSCITGYIFYPPNQCITECPKGTFRNGSVCSLCHPYCQSCSGTQLYCFSCKTSYLMVSSEMSCVASCPNGTFLVGSTCQICQYPCKQCTSQTQCTSCISGTLVGTLCLTSCPSGSYSDSMTCRLCQSPCSQCQTTSTTCKQCINGYYLFNNTCYSSCPSYYFAETQAHQCLQCLGLCGQCQSHINCTTCSTGLTFYYNTAKNYGQCVSQCPISYYKTSITLLSSTRDQCTSCLPQCLTCSNNSACILCKNNSAQYQGQCISECPAQMYSHSGICQSCSPPCLNCTDAFTCTACMNNSFLLVGSAQCIVGQVCPQGFYRIPNTRNCNGRCPAGYYHRSDRTCNNQGCDVDQYKGADMFCYKKCPQGYKSDTNYSCQSCSGQQCLNGLFYNVTPAIIRDQFYLYIIFKQDPIYLLPKPVINLSPSLPHQILTLSTSRLLSQIATQRLLIQSSAIRNITIQLFPQQSFPQTELTLTFQSALATFKNPIQRPSKTVILPGFDLYPDLMKVQFGFLMLLVAVCGMYKNPYMTDFGQLVYLFALIDLHYPSNLASFLQSSSIAHLHNIIKVEQLYATGKAKFSYITDLGLLSNCTINLLFIATGLLIFLILFIIYKILVKVLSYNKVDQDPTENIPHQPQNKQNKSKAIKTNDNQTQINHQQIDGHSEQRKCVKILNCLQKQFIGNLKMGFINRLVYFNYLPLSVFTFGQLTVLKFDVNSLTDFLGSILSIFVVIGLIVFPWYIFSGDKPKYTFLMLRKLVLGLILVLSMENPTYMIGVTAVISIMTGILVGAYGMQKWKVQTKFNAAMEICQAFLMTLFAIFAIIGQGNHTNIRLALSWIIIFTIIGIGLSYIVFSILCVVLWGCKKFRNIDYIQQWNNAKQEQESDNDSQQVHDREKKDGADGQGKLKTRSISKLLAGTQKQPKQDQLKKQSAYNMKNNNNNVPITNNQLFWTYNDHDADGESDGQGNKEPKAPDMLIRCVNEFSDYDPKQKRDQ